MHITHTDRPGQRHIETTRFGAVPFGAAAQPFGAAAQPFGAAVLRFGATKLHGFMMKNMEIVIVLGWALRVRQTRA